MQCPRPRQPYQLIVLGGDCKLDPSIPRHKWVSFPLDYPIFLCESHNNLTSNVIFQDSLLHTLLSLDQDG